MKIQREIAFSSLTEDMWEILNQRYEVKTSSHSYHESGSRYSVMDKQTGDYILYTSSTYVVLRFYRERALEIEEEIEKAILG